jgi:hypothetical protein
MSAAELPVTLYLTAEERRLLRAAVEAMLEDFGHEEADVVHALKVLLGKLPADS